MAAVNNSHRIQHIYEQYMAIASIICSEETTFNITTFSTIMKKIHILLRKKQQTEQTEHDALYYTIRKTDLITPIDTIVYTHLSDIFFNNLDSIFDYIEKSQQSRGKSTTPFIKMCKNNTIVCNEVTNKPCKYCFKFNNEIKGIKMTNAFLNKIASKVDNTIKNAYSTVKPYEQQRKINKLQLHVLNKKIRNAYRTLGNFFTTDLFFIITKLPFNDYGITSKFMFRERHDINSKPTMGYTTYGLSITHTNPYTSKLIIDYISENIWNDTMTEEDCYKIYWLLAIACPFLRGSASFAKVMLNAALLRCKLHPVKETAVYFRQTDWVAMLSPTFEEYYAKKAEMFETDNDFDNKLKDITTILSEINTIKIQSGGYRKKTRITRKKHRKYIK
jgi:hypothetical protein